MPPSNHPHSSLPSLDLIDETGFSDSENDAHLAVSNSSVPPPQPSRQPTYTRNATTDCPFRPSLTPRPTSRLTNPTSTLNERTSLLTSTPKTYQSLSRRSSISSIQPKPLSRRPSIKLTLSRRPSTLPTKSTLPSTTSTNTTSPTTFHSTLQSPTSTVHSPSIPSSPSRFSPSLPVGAEDTRQWYDQFTTTDWVHDALQSSSRSRTLHSRRDLRGRILAALDGAQAWVLIAAIGVLVAGAAGVVDRVEGWGSGWRAGYCGEGFWTGYRDCGEGEWRRWGEEDGLGSGLGMLGGLVIWVGVTVALAVVAGWVTLWTRTVVRLPGVVERDGDETVFGEKGRMIEEKVYHPAAGSGVAEVQVILSGFVLRGFLGLRVLVCKALALVFSTSSGLVVGKEGPYVHIAACVGNIIARLSPKYKYNDAKRRELLSAAAAAGVTVAFGAPLGGVLFSLEAVSYYFPPKILFRTFFCCIVAALSLRLVNPQDNHKTVRFDVSYTLDWKLFELFIFAALGAAGGLFGAFFVKATRFWSTTFRQLPLIKSHPILEISLVALLTGLLSYWNRITRLSLTDLLSELASPCHTFSTSPTTLCPTPATIPSTIAHLLSALAINTVLTLLAFGTKVPAGIYIPSMALGGLLGRIVGHAVQLAIHHYPTSPIFASCPATTSASVNPESCVVPGVYALVAAGAMMCGVTRLSITLAVILFEITGDLDHVLPFSLGVLVAKWTADAIEPRSVYDLLIEMHGYPYLDLKARPMFEEDAVLGDLVGEGGTGSGGEWVGNVVDVSRSGWVEARILRRKVKAMHAMGEVDGGLPVVKGDVLVGLIAVPDLEFALDQIDEQGEVWCWVHPNAPGFAPLLISTDTTGTTTSLSTSKDSLSRNVVDFASIEQSVPGFNHDEMDLTPYVDSSPIALDASSPMDLVFECFTKLGSRYLCVIHEGRYVGIVHKKVFVSHVQALQKRRHRRRFWSRDIS